MNFDKVLLFISKLNLINLPWQNKFQKGKPVKKAGLCMTVSVF